MTGSKVNFEQPIKIVYATAPHELKKAQQLCSHRKANLRVHCHRLRTLALGSRRDQKSTPNSTVNALNCFFELKSKSDSSHGHYHVLNKNGYDKVITPFLKALTADDLNARYASICQSLKL